MKAVTRVKRKLDYILRPGCAICGLRRHHESPLCNGCYQDLPWLAAEHNHPIPYSHTTLSAFTYEPPVNSLLLGIKFGQNLRELSIMGELTASAILPQIDKLPDAILPVPLHTKRLQKRGFNQALELARPLAKTLGIPLLNREVIRCKFTLPQTELDSGQRQQNLQAAFMLKKKLTHQHIVIFDDVITTGTTAGELAKLLRENGAQRVDIWSCARAILRQNHEQT